MSVEVNNESGVDIDEAALARLCRYVLDRLGINPGAELSVVLLDETAMAALHEHWLRLPGPTDVMAFPMDGADLRGDIVGEPSGPRGPDETGGEALLGDVALCPRVAARQAVEAGHSATAELHLLCAHGILHLLGYDHDDPGEEREMFRLQAELLSGWAQTSGLGPIHPPAPGRGTGR